MSKQAEGSDDPNARSFQRRLRLAVSNFAKTQIGGDDMMMISGVITECAAATFELLNRYNYAPTEDQFVAMWAKAAQIVARGEHIVGVHEDGGTA